ncbi:hypothetical protein CN645_19545 [Burkholderia sp. IDO3]|nr:hypothetical protein DCN14_03790 [Burkholderia sp. IDO3]PCD60294.1 hypothetical protein CN645_19545 [Burkholderia sp. IDO3]
MENSPLDPVETRYEAAKRDPANESATGPANLRARASTRHSSDESDDAAACEPIDRESAGWDIESG